MVLGGRMLVKDKTRNLWAIVTRLLQQASYRDQVKQRPPDFTRDRKVGFLLYGASHHANRIG